MILVGLTILCVGNSSLTPTVLRPNSMFILGWRSLATFVGLIMMPILDSSASEELWIKKDFCGDLGMGEIWLLNNWWKDLLFYRFCDFYILSQGTNLLIGDPLLNTTLFLGWGTEFPTKLETIFLCLFELSLGPNVCTGDLLTSFCTLDYLPTTEGLLEIIILDLDLLLSLIGDDFM